MRRQSEHAGGIMIISLVVSLALALSNVATQAVDTPADTAFYAVSYVEVNASSRSAALAAFKQYRSANQRLTGDAGFGRLDTFEHRHRQHSHQTRSAQSDASPTRTGAQAIHRHDRQ